MTRRFQRIAFEFWILVGLVVCWWMLSRDSTSPFWPPLADIIKAVRRNWLFARFTSDLLPTVVAMLGGFSLAAVIGIVAGGILGASRTLTRAFQPALDFLRSVPAVGLIPIGILVFGITESYKVFVVVLAAVWAVQLNTADGVRGIDPAFFETARAYQFSLRDRVRYVMVPAAMPQVFTGLRIALSQAVLLVIVAELVSSKSGVGHFISESQSTFHITDMWSGIIVLALLAYLVNLVFSVAESRALAWHRGWRASALEGEPVPKKSSRRAKAAKAAAEKGASAQ